MSAQTYIPGVCNLGQIETKRRFRSGLVGLVLTALTLLLLVRLKLPSYYWLSLFLPSSMSAIGFLQAQAKFCVAYGFLGLFSFGVKPSAQDKVTDVEAHQKDLRKAQTIVLSGLLIGASFALLGFYFDTFITHNLLKLFPF